MFSQYFDAAAYITKITVCLKPRFQIECLFIVNKEKKCDSVVVVLLLAMLLRWCNCSGVNIVNSVGAFYINGARDYRCWGCVGGVGVCVCVCVCVVD